MVSDLGTNNLEIADWLVYPVPSDDLLYVVSPVESKIEPYVLYDQAGRIVLMGMLSEYKTIISLQNCSVGVYQLKVGNEAHLFKVIRQ